MAVNVITAETATQAYAELLNLLLEAGEVYRPRGMRTRELRPVAVQITGRRRWVGQPTRKLSTALGVLEGLQLVGGFSAPAALVQVAPQYVRFVNPGTGQLDGAYGPRLAEQLPYLRRLLQQDPDTRQAVATIYGPTDQRTSLDVPCTVGLQFFVRADRLELIVNMRSNDAWLGWPYDVIQFSILQEALAADLGVGLGMYTHISGSMHLYERNVEKATLVAQDVRDEGPNPPRVGKQSWETSARDARLAARSWWWGRLGWPVSPWGTDALTSDAEGSEPFTPFFIWCRRQLEAENE